MVSMRIFSGSEVSRVIDDVARLRIEVFRDWPYLYDGDLEYERGYLATYRESPGAVIVCAVDGARIVGASTGTPMSEHADEFGAALGRQPVPLAQIFYCAESVLLPSYRGQGIGHRFFDAREAHARSLGASHAAFCAVIRPDDHPARPDSYAPLDPFWRKRGYEKIDGAVAQFSWKDIGETEETKKPLQFWMKAL